MSNADNKGTGMPVDMQPIAAHLLDKLGRDVMALANMLRPENIRNFQEQNRLLAEIQAGIRARDVLAGVTTLDGNVYKEVQGAGSQLLDFGAQVGRNLLGQAQSLAQKLETEVEDEITVIAQRFAPGKTLTNGMTPQPEEHATETEHQ